MLNLTLNGAPKTLEKDKLLTEALKDWGYENPAIAVAVNGDFVPKHRYRETLLQAGDAIDVVSPMQGG